MLGEKVQGGEILHFAYQIFRLKQVQMLSNSKNTHTFAQLSSKRPNRRPHFKPIVLSHQTMFEDLHELEDH